VNANREAMSVTHGDGTETLPEHMSSPPVFSGVRVTKSLVFCVVVCKLLFVCWSLSLSVLQITASGYPFVIFERVLLSNLI
jgi:hypothetical protein